MRTSGVSGYLTVHGLIICLLVSMTAIADTAGSQSPESMVKAVTAEMLDTLRSHRDVIRRDPEQLASLLERIVAPHFDAGVMAREVLGKYWRRANDAQRRQFQSAFRQLLIDDYAAVFRNYTNQTIEYLPERDDASQDRAVVSMGVDTPGEQRIRVDYRLRRVGTAWRIYDVDVDGISLLINYRDTFSGQLRSQSLDELIAGLQHRHNSFHQKTLKTHT